LQQQEIILLLLTIALRWKKYTMMVLHFEQIS
jgi:hypothetical protein